MKTSSQLGDVRLDARYETIVEQLSNNCGGCRKARQNISFFRAEMGNIQTETIENIAFEEIDQILQGHAFGLVSTFSIEAEQTMQEYLKLKDKPDKSRAEMQAFEQLSLFTSEMLKSQTGHLSAQDLALQQEMLNQILQPSLAP